MKTVIIHLHPDFSQEITEVLKKWNTAQKEIIFYGLTVKREHEVRLLTRGAVHVEELWKIGAQARNEAGYSPDDKVILFTEKRIFIENYYQLFFSGSSKYASPPNVTITSLDFARILFKDSKSYANIYSFIVAMLINSLTQTEGFETHKKSKGCIMDFCNNMTDVIAVIDNGPAYCDEHQKQITAGNKSYLFDLLNAFKIKSNPSNEDTASERILNTNKSRLEDDESEFNYDVALSFAGEDRNYAEELAVILKNKGINVFYDTFEKARLWGEDLYTYLNDLYKLRAKYCIMFLSQHYANKVWTNHERKAAQARAFNERKAYILPVRLDNSDIPGINETIGYLSWENEKAKGIAECVLQKLNMA